MRSDRHTLKDVANLSGYALRTVKKVISGDLSVREQTRKAVLQDAKELNYTRNQAARRLFLYLTEGQLPPQTEQTPLYVLTGECLD